MQSGDAATHHFVRFLRCLSQIPEKGLPIPSVLKLSFPFEKFSTAATGKRLQPQFRSSPRTHDTAGAGTFELSDVRTATPAVGVEPRSDTGSQPWA